jgi:hypothetical protein
MRGYHLPSRPLLPLSLGQANRLAEAEQALARSRPLVAALTKQSSASEIAAATAAVAETVSASRSLYLCVVCRGRHSGEAGPLHCSRSCRRADRATGRK